LIPTSYNITSPYLRKCDFFFLLLKYFNSIWLCIKCIYYTNVITFSTSTPNSAYIILCAVKTTNRSFHIIWRRKKINLNACIITKMYFNRRQSVNTRRLLCIRYNTIRKRRATVYFKRLYKSYMIYVNIYIYKNIFIYIFCYCSDKYDKD